MIEVTHRAGKPAGQEYGSASSLICSFCLFLQALPSLTCIQFCMSSTSARSTTAISMDVRKSAAPVGVKCKVNSHA